MTHDPLCPTHTMCKCKDQECWDCRDVVLCQCDLIAKVRADERRRKGTCWREMPGANIPGNAIRVYREAGWFWEMP